MAKKEDPNVVAKRKQERVAFVQANPQLAPAEARQRFFVQTRMNELAATGSLGDRKQLRENFQTGKVQREGFYTPTDIKRIAGNNSSGPPGTDNTAPPVVVTPTVTPPVTGSTTSTTTPTRPTTNTTTTVPSNQYDKPTTTTALGQVTTTTNPTAPSTKKTGGDGFFDSGIGKFIKDTTTNDPNVGLQGIFNRNLPNVTKVLQIPQDSIESMGRTFVAPTFNLASEKLGSDKRMQTGTTSENIINTAFTLADIFSAGTAMGLHAPASALIKSQFVKHLGAETVTNIAAKTTAAKLTGKSLIDDALAPVAQSPFVNRLGRGGREYTAEQLALNAPKPLSAIPGPPGNPTMGAIMDFGPTRNPAPPGRGSGRGSVPAVPVLPSRVKGRGATPPAPALTVVEGVQPGTTEASMLNHPSYKAPDAPNLSLVPEARPSAPGNPSRNPTPPGNPSRSPKGPNAAPLTPAQKRAATIAAKKEAKLAEAKAAEELASKDAPIDFGDEFGVVRFDDGVEFGNRSDEFGDGWFTPDDAVPEGKQGGLKAPTSTVLTPEKSPTSLSKETTGAPIVNGKVQMPGTEPAHITEMKRVAALEKEGIDPGEIVNREKYDAFGNSTNNDPLIRRVGEEPAGQGPFDSPRSVGPQSLDQAKRRTRRQADPDADEAARMITNDELDRAGLEGVPMGRLIKNNIEIIRADRATRNADLIRDYESRRYPTIDDMSGNPIPTPATNKPLEGVFNANGKVSKKFTDDPAVLAAREEAKKQVAAAGQLKKNTRLKVKRVENNAVKQKELDVQRVVTTEAKPTTSMSEAYEQTVYPADLTKQIIPGVMSQPRQMTSVEGLGTFVDVTKNPITGQANQQSTIELARSLGRNESIPGQAATRGREFADGEFEQAVADLKTRRVNYEETGVMTAQHREVERKLRETFGGERFDRISAAASGQDVPVFRRNTPPLTQTLNMPDMPSGQSLSEFQQVFGRSAETPSAAPRLPELQTNEFAPYSPTNNPGRVRGTSRDEQVASWRNLSTSKEFQQMMIDQPDLAAFIARQNKPFQDILERQAAADSVALEARLSSSVEDKAWATVQEASGGVNEAALRNIREGKDKFVGGPENVNNPLRGTEINPVDPSKQVPVYIQDWSKPGTWKTEFPRQNAIKMSQEEVLKRENVQSVAVQYDETQRVISQMNDLLRNRGGVVGDVALNDFDSAIIDELGAAGMDITQFRRGTTRYNRANRATNNLPYSDPTVTFPESGSKANPLTPEQEIERNAAMDQPANWSLDPFGSFNPSGNNQVVLSDPASLSAAGREFRANMDALLEQSPAIAADFELRLAKSRKSIARREAVVAKRKIATEVGQEASRAEATAWWKEAQPYFEQQEGVRQVADLAAAERPKLTQQMRMEQDQAQRVAGLEQTPVNNNTSGPMTVSDQGPAGEYDPLIGAHVFEWSNPLTGTKFRVETIYGPATDKEYRTILDQKRSYTLKSHTEESTAAMVKEAQMAAREIDPESQVIINDWRNG